MAKDTFKVVQDATMPLGRCCVVTTDDGAVVYGGPIPGLTEEMLSRDHALLILHPVDFADGEAFMKATRH
jgi:hypothetical protein